MHWPALRRINALDSHFRRVLGIPIYCGRECCVAELNPNRSESHRRAMRFGSKSCEQPKHAKRSSSSTRLTIGTRLIMEVSWRFTRFNVLTVSCRTSLRTH